MAKTFDIDALISADLNKAKAEIETQEVKLFGKTFRIYTDVNLYLGLGIDTGDPGSIIGLLNTIIHEDDLAEFKSTLSSQRGLNAEVLVKIVSGLLEAASERPTTPSSGSGTGRKRNTSTKKLEAV